MRSRFHRRCAIFVAYNARKVALLLARVKHYSSHRELSLFCATFSVEIVNLLAQRPPSALSTRTVPKDFVTVFLCTLLNLVCLVEADSLLSQTRCSCLASCSRRAHHWLPLSTPHHAFPLSATPLRAWREALPEPYRCATAIRRTRGGKSTAMRDAPRMESIAFCRHRRARVPVCGYRYASKTGAVRLLANFPGYIWKGFHRMRS